MKIHILNGDALLDKFPKAEFEGEIIVIREAFMDGPVSGTIDEDFWKRRAEFVKSSYGAEESDYAEQFQSQITLLDAITNEDEIFLWFEDDLFCVINLLFTLHYISQRAQPVMYRIFPKADDQKWEGFGRADEKELVENFTQRILMSNEDIELSNQLWEAYASDDRYRLELLANSDTESFRFLPVVIQAHLDRNNLQTGFGRPYQTLMDILVGGEHEFYEIYEAFWKKDAIYGFGDVQVLNMLKEMEVEFDGELPK